MSESYSNIRELLGEIIGRTIVDVTQHDEEYFKETGKGFVVLMFDDGQTLKFDAPFCLNDDGTWRENG